MNSMRIDCWHLLNRHGQDEAAFVQIYLKALAKKLATLFAPSCTVYIRYSMPSAVFRQINSLCHTRKLCYRNDDRARYISGSNESLRRYGHMKLSKMAACRQLGFVVTGNSAIRSADPENPTLQPNMKCIGSPVAVIWPFAYLGSIWNPHFWEGEVVAMAPFERAMLVSYGSLLWPLRYL